MPVPTSSKAGECDHVARPRTAEQVLLLFIGPKSDHCLLLSLTDSLTDCCLVDLIDVTLACEEANTKLVDVVADENRIGNNLLKISEPRFGQKA